MKCPFCGKSDSRVIDSRPSDDDTAIRRRRECPVCNRRWSTVETVERTQLIVVKKSGARELFDKNKLLNGVLKATEKRPVDGIAVVNEIENELQNELLSEVPSTKIGEMVMEKLRERDAVAYVRFASVYREFRDIDSFLRELKELRKEKS